MSCGNDNSINQIIIIEPQSLTGGTDVHVTGGTYNNPTGTAVFTNNTGGTFSVSGFYTGSSVTSSITAVTFSNNILNLINSTGGTISTLINNFSGLTVGGAVSATTYYGDGSNLLNIHDTYLTGGTYSNGTTTFRNNTGGTFTVTGFTDNDRYVTGATFSNNVLNLTTNSGGTISTLINSFSGLTVGGAVSATTYYGDGSNLTGITDTNFANTDLSSTGNRTHDFNNNKLNIDNLNQFRLTNISGSTDFIPYDSNTMLFEMDYPNNFYYLTIPTQLFVPVSVQLNVDGVINFYDFIFDVDLGNGTSGYYNDTSIIGAIDVVCLGFNSIISGTPVNVIMQVEKTNFDRTKEIAYFDGDFLKKADFTGTDTLQDVSVRGNTTNQSLYSINNSGTAIGASANNSGNQSGISISIPPSSFGFRPTLQLSSLNTASTKVTLFKLDTALNGYGTLLQHNESDSNVSPIGVNIGLWFSGHPTTNYITRVPQGNGFLTLSVNGYTADSTGNIVVANISDITVTGGTYNNPTGTAVFTNNTGGTFSVSGFYTGITIGNIGSQSDVNGAIMSGNTFILLPASETFGGIITSDNQSMVGNKSFGLNNTFGPNAEASFSVGNSHTIDGGACVAFGEASTILGEANTSVYGYGCVTGVEVTDSMVGGTGSDAFGGSGIISLGVANHGYFGHTTVIGGEGNQANNLYSSVYGGLGNNVSGDYSGIFSGLNNILNGENSAIIAGSGITGNNNNTVYVPNLIAIDSITATSATFNGTLSQGLSSIASGLYSHAEGNGTIASGDSSHAEGKLTSSDGLSSHAEGVLSMADGNYSHAEGNSTLAHGESSHTEGNSTTANGNYSHAEGESSTSDGLSSHAEGFFSMADGDYSHAEGESTISRGEGSHAEGGSSISYGNFSHSEGQGSHSYGDYSHTEGSSTTASGSSSHAEGLFTIAEADYQHVSGRYNTTGNTSNSISIIGSGSDSNNRGDAFRVDLISGSTASITHIGKTILSGTVSNPLQITGLSSSGNTRYLVIDTNGVVSYTTPTDITVTGGTYNNPTGIATFRNNTGGTFSVSGFTTGGTSSSDTYVTGATGNDSTKVYTFTNNTGGTFTLNALTDVRVTGSTFSNNILTFTNNTGGTFSNLINNLSGLTVNGAISATTISSTTITSPLILGGNGTSTTLTLKTTTGVGGVGSDMIFLVGSNGATEGLRITNAGLVTTSFNIVCNNLLASTLVRAGAASSFSLFGRSKMSSSADGLMEFTTNAGTANSATLVFGGIRASYVAKGSAYTATSTDYTINCTGNTFTVTLPTAVGILGHNYTVKNSGAGVITLATTSSQTIDGVTTKTLSVQYGGLRVQSNGSNWIVIGSF